jgi:hypothetical protein
MAPSERVFGAEPPATFPRFVVPGQEREMDAVRRLFWLHYEPAGPFIPLASFWTILKLSCRHALLPRPYSGASGVLRWVIGGVFADISAFSAMNSCHSAGTLSS